MTFLLLALIFIISLYFSFRCYAKYKLNYWKRLGIEQLPTSSLIFGNFKDAVLFQSPPGWHLGNVYKAAPNKDSPYLGFYIFHKPCLMIRDPEVIKQMMIRDFDNFSDRYFGGTPQRDSFGMKNLFGLKNPTWKYLRSRITPTMSKNKIVQMLPLIVETGKPMMEYLKHESSTGKSHKIIDAQDMNYKFTTDLIANIALGVRVNSFDDPNGEFTKAVQQFFRGLKRMVALVCVFFMPELVELAGQRILFNAKFIGNIFWDAVKSREKNGGKRGDYIDSIIELKNGEQNPDYKFEGENLLYQAGTFFSGFESSATSTAFMLLELATHLEVQQRVREDINRAIKKHGMTYEGFNDMKYLDQCLGECIRLHPPVPTIDRLTKEDYILPGTDITIKKGTPVYLSLIGMQRDTRFFEQPMVFDPERFAKDAKVPEAYIPFGIGPRMCIGQKLAQMHEKAVLSMILREYEVTTSKENDITLDSRATFTVAKNGISLYFRKIT